MWYFMEDMHTHEDKFCFLFYNSDAGFENLTLGKINLPTFDKMSEAK